MRPAAGAFKNFLQEELKENNKTSWGKNELALFIEKVYSDFIERYLED